MKGHKLLLFIYISTYATTLGTGNDTQQHRHARTSAHTTQACCTLLMYESIILRSQFSVDYCLNYILLDNITYLNVSCNKGALKQYNSTRREGGREAELESHSHPLTPSVCACVCLSVCVAQSAGCCRCAHTVWYFHSHCTIRPSIFRGG